MRGPFIFLTCLLTPLWAHALDMPQGGRVPDMGATPLTIEAQGTLELHQNNHQYIATGGVVITQGADHLTADRVVVDYVEVSGQPQITQMTATGQAKVTQKTDTIAADKIVAEMGNDSTGARVMTRATATGHVVITTPTETATGTKGVYTRAGDTAILEGPVTLTRGKNILNGARASVNLKTGLSTVYSDASGKAPVRGIFYPETKK